MKLMKKIIIIEKKKKNNKKSKLKEVQEHQLARKKLREEKRFALDQKILKEKMAEKKALFQAKRESREAYNELASKIEKKQRKRLMDLEEGRYDPTDDDLDRELASMKEDKQEQQKIQSDRTQDMIQKINQMKQMMNMSTNLLNKMTSGGKNNDPLTAQIKAFLDPIKKDVF